MAEQRTIIIGDVHGCADELQDLCDALAITEADRVFFIGDLINKGPDSRGCYEHYLRLGARSILGNHELALLDKLRCGEGDKGLARRMREAFGDTFDAFVEDVKTWPLYIEEQDFLLVHGGLLPGYAPSETAPWPLVSIRTWDGKGEDLQNENNPPWFDFYRGDKLVVFGHWAALGGIVRDKVIGLDTGCVYGGQLSALVLPSRELVRVPARTCYQPVD